MVPQMCFNEAIVKVCQHNCALSKARFRKYPPSVFTQCIVAPGYSVTDQTISEYMHEQYNPHHDKTTHKCVESNATGYSRSLVHLIADQVPRTLIVSYRGKYRARSAKRQSFFNPLA